METHANPWLLSETYPFQTQSYEPLYLANTFFGGQLDLSGTDMALWSASIAGRNQAESELPDVLFPCTALRTRAFYRNAHYREAGFWVGRSGLLTDDPNYTADPAMPHLPQVYAASQQLDLRGGTASTEASLFPGTEAAFLANQASERAIHFRSQMAFLKDAPLLGLRVECDESTEIALLPETVLEEHLIQRVSGQGICKVGSEIDCAIRLRQTIIDQSAADACIEYRIQPRGGAEYRIRVTSPNGQLTSLLDRPALTAHGRHDLLIQILPPGSEPAQELSIDALFAEQARRWQAFWEQADVHLPKTEALWQQRYHASLFYVAQSLGDGPTHPVGLSKPNYPHWFGCFHDTDTYFCRPLLERGHFAAAGRHLEYRHRTLARAIQFAEAQDLPGALYPWQSDLEGNGEARECPVNSAIIAMEALNHFAYGRDPDARVKAAAILSEIFRGLCALLDNQAEEPRLRSGPILTFSETMEAESPGEAILALRCVAAAYLRHVKRPEAELTARAQAILEAIPQPTAADGSYRILPDVEPEYMRCPSITLGAFPLHHLHADEALAKTFAKELGKIVFSFAWLPHQLSIVASQLGIMEGPSAAASLLRQADRFYKPWHAYDEWENRRTGRAEHFVTAAGGFATALHHMLIAETEAGLWTLFPGAPPEWKDLSFDNLHTRAGWIVSASLSGGVLQQITARPVGPAADPVFRLKVSHPLADTLSKNTADENGIHQWNLNDLLKTK
jgi:hypothetical protein